MVRICLQQAQFFEYALEYKTIISTIYIGGEGGGVPGGEVVDGGGGGSEDLQHQQAARDQTRKLHSRSITDRL